MIRDVLDTHTHTLASGHAYSTIRENVKAAKERGLELLAITEHAPLMPGSCHSFYFQNLRVIDRAAYEVELLMGVELNILDGRGSVDLEQKVLQQMDIAIASLHPPCFKAGSTDYNTQACISVMKNPYVNILGHPDDTRIPLDHRALAQAAKEYGVLLEVNNSSLSPKSHRKDSREMYVSMLKFCVEYQVPIVMGSDAHVDTDVGNHGFALRLLEEIGFPEELVVNRSAEELKKYVNRYKYS